MCIHVFIVCLLIVDVFSRLFGVSMLSNLRVMIWTTVGLFCCTLKFVDKAIHENYENWLPTNKSIFAVYIIIHCLYLIICTMFILVSIHCLIAVSLLSVFIFLYYILHFAFGIMISF